jgi:hypothetical protein
MNAQDWNRCLIDAVFSTDTGTGPVRTIKATDKFLALASSSPSDSPQVVRSVRNDFIRAFSGSHRQVRRLFEYDHQMALWRLGQGRPPFFGQLYLSLLIASATEETHGDGDFRRRFCLMLKLPFADYIANGLPRLWEQLATWSVGQSQAHQPIRRLVLPDPGHETIIGYSKRLAFPGYSDAARLSQILFENVITHESPLKSILDVIGKNLRSFSLNFQSEYAHLLRVVRRDPDAACLLPMWAAIEAVSFERVGKSIRTKARFSIELAFDDFGRPDAYLFSDMEPAKVFDSKCRAKPIGKGPSRCGWLIELQSSTSMLSTLLSRGTLRSLLKGTAVDRQIEQGCVVFAPSEEAPWVWRPSLPTAGPVQCICRDAARTLLAKFYESQQISMARVEAISEAPGWYLTELEDCGAIAQRSSGLDGLDDYDALLAGITIPKIILRGAVRLPHGILLTNASRPEVLAIGCDKVYLTATYETDASVALGATETTPRVSCFRPSVDQLARLKLPAVVNFIGVKASEVVTLRTFSDNCVPDVPLTLEVDFSSYLEESPLGQLTSGVDGARSAAEVQDNTGNDLALDLVARGRMKLEALQSGFVTGKALEGSWEDVCEALYGAFLNARSLPDSRIIELGSAVFFPIQQVPAAYIVTLLCHGRKIMKRWHRKWRGVRYFPILPFLQFDERSGKLQMVGLTSRIMRQRFREITGTSEVTYTPVDYGPPAAPELPGVTRSIADKVAVQMRLPLAVEGRQTLRNGRTIIGNISARYRKNLAQVRYRFWSSKYLRFLDATTPEACLLLRLTELERAPSIYEILSGNHMVWATESRAWAVFMYRMLTNTLTISVDNGCIVSDQPLPLIFATAAIGSSGGLGLCFLDRTAKWIYRFGSLKSLSTFLREWTRPIIDPDMVSASRWALSLSNGLRPSVGRADGSAFARRYSAYRNR